MTEKTKDEKALATAQPSAMSPEQQRRAQVRGWIEAAKPELVRAAGKMLDPERFVRVALTTIGSSGMLMQCSQQSLILGMLRAAGLGLDLDATLGEAYLVPRRNHKLGTWEANFQVGYQGLMKLAWRSDEIASVEARVVRERDEFRFAYGLRGNALRHVPHQGDDDPGDMKAAYCVIRYRSGGEHLAVLSRREVLEHRALSQSWASDSSRKESPWTKFPEAMWLKTAIRVAMKLAPKSSSQVARALNVDEYSDRGVAVQVTEEEGNALRSATGAGPHLAAVDLDLSDLDDGKVEGKEQ